MKPTQFGVVDRNTLFVAFEGRATEHTPLFKVSNWGGGPQVGRVRAGRGCCAVCAARSLLKQASNAEPCPLLQTPPLGQGVDLFYFDDDASQIREVEGEQPAGAWLRFGCGLLVPGCAAEQ